MGTKEQSNVLETEEWCALLEGEERSEKIASILQ